MAESYQYQHVELKVRGLVQGVNFRETVRHLAYPMALMGEVWNDPEDTDLVHVIAEGRKDNIDRFINTIESMKRTEPENGEIIGARSFIHVDSIEEMRKDLKDRAQIQFHGFKVRPPEGANPAEREMLQKLSYGGMVYSNFHRDHNLNFQTLENKFGAVTATILEVGTGIIEQIGSLPQKMKDLMEEKADNDIEE